MNPDQNILSSAWSAMWDKKDAAEGSLSNWQQVMMREQQRVLGYHSNYAPNKVDGVIGASTVYTMKTVEERILTTDTRDVLATLLPPWMAASVSSTPNDRDRFEHALTQLLAENLIADWDQVSTTIETEPGFVSLQRTTLRPNDNRSEFSRVCKQAMKDHSHSIAVYRHLAYYRPLYVTWLSEDDGLLDLVHAPGSNEIPQGEEVSFDDLVTILRDQGWVPINMTVPVVLASLPVF